MKLWQAYCSEHSARVKIVGTFESVDDARNAAALFNRLLEIKDKYRNGDSTGFLPELAEVCRDSDLSDFAPATDASQLELFEEILPAGIEIRVESNSTDIQALLKVLIRYGAKIEILSRAPCAK